MVQIIMTGYNTDLSKQVKQLTKILKSNKEIYSIIEKAQTIGFKDYYIGAGCITQTVWNYQSGYGFMNGISDIDFVYYDDTDLSPEAENNVIQRITDIMNPCKIKLDIKNQARVHLWYKNRFGYDIKPYNSIEEAINSWPTTATSVGVRLNNGKLTVYAPYGLNDMFGMIVRANKLQITQEIYMQKANKWISKWNALTVIPW